MGEFRSLPAAVILSVFCCFACLVTGLVDSIDEHGSAGVTGNYGSTISKVDAGLRHTGNTAQCAFHGGDAAGTAHAVNIEAGSG